MLGLFWRPAVKTPCFQGTASGFDPWLGKLRSHMPHGTAKNIIYIYIYIYNKITLHSPPNDMNPNREKVGGKNF